LQATAIGVPLGHKKRDREQQEKKFVPKEDLVAAQDAIMNLDTELKKLRSHFEREKRRNDELHRRVRELGEECQESAKRETRGAFLSWTEASIIIQGDYIFTNTRDYQNRTEAY